MSNMDDDSDDCFGVVPREDASSTGTYIPRIKNMGKIQRENLTGELKGNLPVIVFGRRDLTLHGTTEGGTPATLVIFKWYLHERERGKRFQSLRITFTFRTKRPHPAGGKGRVDAFYDPTVVGVAPRGTYGLLRTTETRGVKTTAEASLTGGFGGIAQGGGKLGYELSRSAETSHHITINGMESNEHEDGEDYNPDHYNTVEWNLFENDSQSSGLPTFFRTAVLLERHRRDAEQFTGTFQLESDVNGMSNVLRGFKKFFGRLPKDDPVVFDPSAPPTAKEADLMAFRYKLDKVDLEETVKFVMYKEAAPKENNKDDKQGGGDAK